MCRRASEERLDEIRDIIRARPGQRAGRIARTLGCDNKTVQRALPQLEARGDLLWEDERGRLFWFKAGE